MTKNIIAGGRGQDQALRKAGLNISDITAAWVNLPSQSGSEGVKLNYWQPTNKQNPLLESPYFLSPSTVLYRCILSGQLTKLKNLTSLIFVKALTQYSVRLQVPWALWLCTLRIEALHKWRWIAGGRNWQMSELKMHSVQYECISWQLALLAAKMCFKKSYRTWNFLSPGPV